MCDNTRAMNGLRSAITAALLACAAGCGGQPGVSVYDAPKDGAPRPRPTAPPAPPAGPAMGMPSGPMGGGDMGAMGGGDAGTGADLAWSAPAGWTAQGASGMRRATFKIPGGVELSVVVLPGSAGGTLANVNRWRGQIGLDPIDAGALAKSSERIAAPAGTVTLIDATGTAQGRPSRLVGGLLEFDGRAWFFKATGEPAAVGAAKADVLRFLKTLQGGSRAG